MRHNIFTISLCIHCTYNVNLYYRLKKLAILYTFTKFVQYLPFFVQMCIVGSRFVAQAEKVWVIGTMSLVQ